VQNGFKQLGEPWFEIYIFCLSFSFPDNRYCGISSGGNSVSLWATALLATWGVSLILQQRSVNCAADWNSTVLSVVLVVCGF